MKKSIIICDICSKEIDENKDDYVLMYQHKKGKVTERIDVCSECYDKAFEKGGVE